MRGWWQDLTDLVLPAECGGCGMPRTVLCPECRAALNGAVPSRVRPVPEPPGLPVVHAAARYADEVRAVLLAHKERGALTLAGPLGTALAGAVRAGLEEGRDADPGAPVLLVPVPSAGGVVRARGHDPARRIALAAAGGLRRAGTPARVAAVLRQRRAVADQSGLTSRQRMANLAGALTVVAGGAGLLAGGRVVLVDDLMTTGASLAEAARAVREAAGRAAADRRGGRDSEADRDTHASDPYRSRGGTVPPPGWGGAVPHGETAEPDPGAQSPVYARVRGEGSEERKPGAQERTYGPSTGPRMTGTNRAGNVIRAAVVAASPDSFELNRN
ncbi:ComF family protein [Streptomyces sp. DH24]|uniref:ComF family protein n=1 Tax=Streptomyces sp. DH24 TaxID=3040123 RepID=UPI0024411869|nr:ComF family protein [Streptomyces sp. DH24]MDG9720289.1 ComF family protein [Streptomyces sp. DH24]